MYHSIRTTEKERHLRRILWRDADENQSIKVYGTEGMMFGVRPAAAIASVALRTTATIYKDMNEEAAETIIRDSYVDDIATRSDDYKSVELLQSAIEDILEKGGFKLKGFVTSGVDCDAALKLLGSGDLGRVLGMGWEPREDVFKIKVRINLSNKYKKGRSSEDILYEDIPSIVEMKLTKKLLLSFVNFCYEPLGLSSTITVQMKIAMRKLYSRDNILGWDNDIPLESKE